MSSNAPILYLDTCAILDILRDPIRSDIYEDHQSASLALLANAESGAYLVAVVADLVHSEFSKHVDRVQDEAEKSISRLQDHIEKLDRLAALHGSPGDSSTDHWKGHVTGRGAAMLLNAGYVLVPW